MVKEPKRLFYKIGEVCKLANIEPHVLRYWESEFHMLSPAKNNSGQRIYRERDIELILRIKKLLYEEGYTIAGANKKMLSEYRKKRIEHVKKDRTNLSETGHDDWSTTLQDVAVSSIASLSTEPAENPSKKALSVIKEELESLLTLLDKSV